MGARRWFHERFNRHKWETITHRHDVVQGDEKFDYDLSECRCGALVETVIVKQELPCPIPGIRATFHDVTFNELDRIEDSKVWAGS